MKPSLEKVITMLQLMERYARLYEAERRLQNRKVQRTRKNGLVKRVVQQRPYTTAKLKPRPTAPRYEFDAKIVMQKNGRYLKGRSLNISRSGIFVAAGLGIFRDNETIRVQIRPAGVSQTYTAIARVVRYSQDPRYPMGYGLQFVTGTESGE